MLLVDELRGRADEDESFVADAELAGVLFGDGVSVAGGLAFGDHESAVACLGSRAIGHGGHRDQEHIALADMEGQGMTAHGIGHGITPSNPAEAPCRVVGCCGVNGLDPSADS